MNIADDMRSFVEAPFTQTMSVLHVFLLTGLVVVSIILWSRVIARLDA